MIPREYFNRVTLELVEALYAIPIEEIEETRRDWLNELDLCPKAIDFCNAVTDAVIEYKLEADECR